MLRWNAVVLLFSLTYAGLRAGEPLFVPHGAAAMGMAFAVTATPDHWSSFNNQALLTYATGASTSIAFETRFMMPALSSKALSAIIATGPVPLGFVAGLGSAITVSKGISFGVQVDCVTERAIGDYRDATQITFEMGMIFTLSQTLTMGFHMFNPIAPLNSLPSSINAGLQWETSDDLLFSLDTSKTTDEPLCMQCGMSWSVLRNLILRSGYMSSPSSFAFGIGFITGSLQTDAGFLINSITGISSSLSLIWTIRK
jgi:hypothetical protein